MSPFKALHFDGHALDQMRIRGFTRQDVKWLMARGRRSLAPTWGGDQRWEARGYLGRREAQVIFIPFPTHDLVVTVAWIQKKEQAKRRERRFRRKNKGGGNG